MRRIKQLSTRLAATALTAVLLAACTPEMTNDAPTGMFSLTYTLPVAETHTSRAGTGATTTENAISTLHLLFFAADAHRNGTYIETVSVTLPPSTTLSTGTLDIALPSGSTVDNNTNYDVLVVANMNSYTTNATKLTGMTLGRASAELRATLTNAGMPTNLLMTGIASKQAGKNINVDLLRAAVRIDVKSSLTLSEVRLWNVPSAIPFYYSESGLTADRVNFNTALSGDNLRFYTTETYQDLSDARLRLTKATCLLIKTAYNGTQYWYRVDVVVDANNIQFLQRNNAYTVNISGVTKAGSATPEQAYNSQTTLLSEIKLEGWKDDGNTTVPEIDIN